MMVFLLIVGSTWAADGSIKLSYICYMLDCKIDRTPFPHGTQS